MKKKYKTEDLEELMIKVWDLKSIPFYFAQVLTGECSAEETIDDIESLIPRHEKGEGK